MQNCSQVFTREQLKKSDKFTWGFIDSMPRLLYMWFSMYKYTAYMVASSENNSCSLQRIHESHQGEAVNFIPLDKNSTMVCVGAKSPNND
jgi:hypothetical protein